MQKEPDNTRNYMGKNRADQADVQHFIDSCDAFLEQFPKPDEHGITGDHGLAMSWMICHKLPGRVRRQTGLPLQI